MSIVDEIKGIEAQAATKSTADYRDLVVKTVNGKPPKAAAAAAILSAAGKSSTDFASDVAALQSRKDKIARVQGLPALRKQQTTIETELAANEKQFVAARQTYCTRNDELQDNLSVTTSKIFELDQLEGELAGACTDAALLAQEDEIRGRLIAANKECEVHQQKFISNPEAMPKDVLDAMIARNKVRDEFDKHQAKKALAVC